MEKMWKADHDKELSEIQRADDISGMGYCTQLKETCELRVYPIRENQLVYSLTSSLVMHDSMKISLG